MTASQARFEFLRSLGNKRSKTIILIGVSGTLLSCLLYGALLWEEKGRVREEFKHRSSDRMMSIDSEVKSGIAMVHAVAAFMQSSPEVNRERFRTFTRRLLAQDTTIQAIGWDPRLSASELPSHALSAKTWYPDYKLTEMDGTGAVVEIDLDQYDASTSRDFVVVDFIEPLDENRSALGFDIASEPIRREALNRARDTGNLASTAPIKLVQETEEQFGMLILAPIYRKGVELTSVQQRRTHLEGVVGGVYRIGDTVDAALGNLGPQGIDVYVFDSSSSIGQQLVYVHSSRLRSGTQAHVEDLASLKEQEMCGSSNIEVGGRQWTLCCVPTADYIASRQTWLPFAALAGGLTGTLALIAYLASLSRMTDRLQHLLAQRKKAERALQITQRSIDSSHIPVFWVRPDAQFCYVNNAAAESLGYNANELCGMRVMDIAPSWPVDEWPHRWAQLKEARSARFDALHRRKDGSTFPVEIMVNYFSYSGDEYMHCLALDITEQQRQHERMRERERELAHVSRLSTLGEMVAGIAHEINQPLSAISAYSEACSSGLAASDYQAALPIENWMQQIGQQALRCGDIIRRLRNFVKKNEAERTRVNVNEIVEESVALLSSDIRHTPVSTNWRRLESCPVVVANRVELQQVVVNLLRNAYEAVCSSESTDQQVHVSGRTSDDSVELTVEDHGQGIDNEHAAKLFDAFFTTKADGMGMGLAISKSIVDAHGGRLWAESCSPHGARFHLELPLAKEAAHAA